MPSPETRSIVILAAGRGTRLGGDTPKPLTPVGTDGETLISRQLRLLQPLRDTGWRATVVIGHQEAVMRAALPDVDLVVNPRYGQTNTSKSLMLGLESVASGALWLNADVLFSEAFADQVIASVQADVDFVGVSFGRTAEEEVKFRLDASGAVSHLSKKVVGGLGEAIGVNYVSAASRAMLVRALHHAGDQDYFEAAVETLVAGGHRWIPLDLSEHFAVEVDFPEDLARALSYTRSQPATAPV